MTLPVGNLVWERHSIGSGTTVVYDDNSTVTNGLFVLTPDQKTVIYAYTQASGDAGGNGIYSVPLP